MSKLSSFVEKGVTALPSGKNAGGLKNNWKKIMQQAGSAIADFKDALGLGVSKEEKAKMIASVPKDFKLMIELDYDKKLHSNIEMLEKSGQNPRMAVCYAHKKTLGFYKSSMKKDKSAADYLLMAHAQDKVNESREVAVTEGLGYGAGDFTFCYLYKSDFKDSLKKSIDARDVTPQTRMAAQLKSKDR